MTPDEWAEVFQAGANEDASLTFALHAMANKCTDIAKRGRGPQEDYFMGKPVSELTYQEAIQFRHWLLVSNTQWIREDTSRVVNEIIARGPEEDRDPIAILPPTVLIQGGRDKDA